MAQKGFDLLTRIWGFVTIFVIKGGKRKMIHLVEVEGDKPEDGEIVRTKCNKELIFRPFSPSLNKKLPICADCDTSGPTKIPNFLSVLETPVFKRAGA